MRKLIATFALLVLAGCSTTGVNVVHVAPHEVGPIPVDLSFQVLGDHEPTVYAATQALRSTIHAAPPTHSGSTPPWRLRTDAGVAMEGEKSRDLFCGRCVGMYDPWWRYGPYSIGHGYPMACSSVSQRTRMYPVRTITWTVENSQGQLVWQASARENRAGNGPPIEPSMRLARSLDQWLGQNAGTAR